ncbi:MAG: P-loop NTPase [Candidatus Kapabacteria bacterium]|nr:P-loop NTPase [Candidatus Kapabacteria bacterium]MDW8011987.1 P-loop NTPase [Bacteroidota bacterium]
MNDGMPSFPLIVAACSGRTGVGKSTTLLNMAFAARESGFRCLLWDADLRRPNLHSFLGLSPLATAADSYLGHIRIEDVPIPLQSGMWLVPERPASHTETEIRFSIAFLNLLRMLCERLQPHIVLVDTAAGWSESVAAICRTANICCLFMGDDIGSILDAYGLLKAFTAQQSDRLLRSAGFVITNVVEEEDADLIAQKLSTATQHFLGLSLPLFGSVPYDARHREALLLQTPFIVSFPCTPAAQAHRSLVYHLAHHLATESAAVLSHDASTPPA